METVGLNRSSSKCFFDFPSLSAHKILLELTHVSTLIYYYPTNPFFWPKQATLFSDTLCLTGCYPPNKQGSSFVELTLHISHFNSNFIFAKRPSLTAQLGWDVPSLSCFSTWSRPHCSLLTLHSRLTHLLCWVLFLRSYKFKDLQHLSR